MSNLYQQFVIKKRKPEISRESNDTTYQKKINCRSKHWECNEKQLRTAGTVKENE